MASYQIWHHIVYEDAIFIENYFIYLFYVLLLTEVHRIKNSHSKEPLNSSPIIYHCTASSEEEEKKEDTSVLPMQKSDFPCCSRRETKSFLYNVFGSSNSDFSVLVLAPTPFSRVLRLSQNFRKHVFAINLPYWNIRFFFIKYFRF